jgi:rare lipoprotein A
MRIPSPQRRAALLLASALVLSACGSLRTPDSGSAPDTKAPRTTAAPTPPPFVKAEPAPAPPAAAPQPGDAVPRVERIARGAPNVPYEVNGRHYVPERDDVPLLQTGIASWYGKPFHGRPTASGEVYDMHAMTAAHKTMPLPSYARVRNPANGREVIVRVNDRGPFKAGRIIDLSQAAARRLRISGVAPVVVTRLTHDEIRSGAWQRAPMIVADSSDLAGAE